MPANRELRHRIGHLSIELESRGSPNRALRHRIDCLAVVLVHVERQEAAAYGWREGGREEERKKGGGGRLRSAREHRTSHAHAGTVAGTMTMKIAGDRLDGGERWKSMVTAGERRDGDGGERWKAMDRWDAYLGSDENRELSWEKSASWASLQARAGIQ
ncbi:hypothetical protein E2562_023111 [Oryza meyeriana var. granulata]|uniref:Uncharacterized protein n=1 Tax=Oryza meyeriana var. granulata TaxID=110450 RepID=A0A6G1E101_9ORYZ|nr:hypothetical protein E2562_023111 [Oryza meyeriana var. granulata]